MTTTMSAYPLPVDAVTDRVREHATRAGAWPSLRQVMNDCRVGRPKAVAALAALRASGFEPTPDTATTVPLPTVPPASAAPDVEPSAVEDTPAGPTAPDAVFSPVSTAVDAPDMPGADLDVSVSPAVSGPGSDAVPVQAPAPDRWGAWPLVVIALGAFVAIWGGWVGLGELTGFGPIRLLPGIADQVVINSAITLPLGMEAYAAFALRAWLRPDRGLSSTARRFARRSALGALTLGAAGQVAYHLMVAAGITVAPWPITAFVACLPVIVLGWGAALTHLIHRTGPTTGEES